MVKLPKITLKKVKKYNLIPILQLDVSQEQKRFVAPNAVSTAQAHFNKDAWFRAIYADNVPIGFVMISGSSLNLHLKFIYSLG